jgi:hypothetical protein
MRSVEGLFPALLLVDMKHNPHNSERSNARFSVQHMADGLRQGLDSNYGRIFLAARNQWDRKFAGREASDACVSVRISGRTQLALDRIQPRSQYASIAA